MACNLQGLLVSEELANQVHEAGSKAYRVKKTGLDRYDSLEHPLYCLPGASHGVCLVLEAMAFPLWGPHPGTHRVGWASCYGTLYFTDAEPSQNLKQNAGPQRPKRHLWLERLRHVLTIAVWNFC